MKYIKRGNNLGKEKSIHRDNNSHLYVSPEEEKDASKNHMYQTQQNKHVKIIQSGQEKQEKKPKEE